MVPDFSEISLTELKAWLHKYRELAEADIELIGTLERRMRQAKPAKADLQAWRSYLQAGREIGRFQEFRRLAKQIIQILERIIAETEAVEGGNIVGVDGGDSEQEDVEDV